MVYFQGRNASFRESMDRKIQEMLEELVGKHGIDDLYTSYTFYDSFFEG